MKIFKKQKQNKLSQIKSFSVKAICLLALFLMPNTLIAQTLDQKIRDAENALSRTKNERNTLAGQLSIIDLELSSAQLQINRSTAEINNLNGQIAQINNSIKKAEEDLARKRLELGAVVQSSYEEGQLSNLELIAKSRNFSDFVNRTEYLETIHLKISEISGGIVKLKEELEDKKADTENKKNDIIRLRSEQLNQRASIEAQRQQRAYLLNITKGQENGYQNLLKSLYAERAAAAAESGQGFGGKGSTGGYPYAGNCGGVDPWAYYKCQCTSYAAWFFNNSGRSWTNQLRFGYGTGHAYNWVNHAAPQGYSVYSTPRVGSIAVWPIRSLQSPSYSDPYGHVAIVTAVNGNNISVSEYNFTNPEAYGTRTNVPIYWRNSFNGNYYSLSFIY